MSIYNIQGKIGVRLIRPPMRFGYALFITAENDGGTVTHIAEVQDGELVMVPYDSLASDPKPTAYLTDEIVKALRQALVDDVDQPLVDPGTRYLYDVIGVRDRLLTLVEKLSTEGN